MESQATVFLERQIDRCLEQTDRYLQVQLAATGVHVVG